MVYEAEEPLCFLAANEGRILGGTHASTPPSIFLQEVDGEFLPDPLTRKVIFYEADIKLDAIISYPLLRKNKIGIFPHHNALAMDSPVFTLLFPEGERQNPQRKERVEPTLNDHLQLVESTVAGGGRLCQAVRSPLAC